MEQDICDDAARSNQVAIEFDEPFDAFNNPAVECRSEFSTPSGEDGETLSEAAEEEFLQRYEELNKAVTEPFQPLSELGTSVYGETVTFSDRNIIVFCCVFGPEYMQMIASSVLCLAPTIVQTCVLREDLPVSLHVLTWFFLLITLATLVWTSVVDPGIVPKRMSTLEPVPPRIKFFANEKETTGLRYCPTCDIYRGPRTHHCGICGNCVDQFDHHCPWTGTCIGAKNYHAFLCFLHALHLLAGMIIISSTVATVDRSRKFNVGVTDALKDLYYIPVVLICFILLSGVSITGLVLFHWYLLIRNLTTAEFLKSVYAGDDDNPWNLGVWKNISAKWLGWVDKKTFSDNYRCYVVREVVRREVELLSRERDEELRLRREQRRAREMRDSCCEEPRPTEDRPTFADDGTDLYI
jgi:hypothetical protein